MIDLDALEVACADGEKWLHDWYDGGGAPTPPTVAALVRAVRAAEVITDWRDFSAEYAGPDLIVKQREDWDALEASLAPFRPLGLHA